MINSIRIKTSTMETIEGRREELGQGVDFSKCQLDNILKAYLKGQQIEFESFSPYVADYDLFKGDIHTSPLTNADDIGIAVAKTIRQEFPNAKMVSLYDEYNTGLPDSTDSLGKPMPHSPQIELDETVKQNFHESVDQLLREQGVLSNEDKEGADYLLISESSKIKDAEKLVERLEKAGHIQRDGQAIYFVNSKPEDSTYSKILLRTKQGRWLCEALDTASYLNPENLKITHLVILPNEFREQQNKVWEILRALDIKPTNYHNIFFDKTLPPETVARNIREVIQKAKKDLPT